MSETQEARLKRLRMRSWRRGTKEMDLILGPYADEHLWNMGPEALAAYEALLEEMDSDLYPWITGAQEVPDRHAALIKTLREFATSRAR